MMPSGSPGGDVMSMPTAEKHQHDWFPVAVDYDDEFIILECAGCTERAWRNVYRLAPAEV